MVNGSELITLGCADDLLSKIKSQPPDRALIIAVDDYRAAAENVAEHIPDRMDVVHVQKPVMILEAIEQMTGTDTRGIVMVLDQMFVNKDEVAVDDLVLDPFLDPDEIRYRQGFLLFEQIKARRPDLATLLITHAEEDCPGYIDRDTFYAEAEDRIARALARSGFAYAIPADELLDQALHRIDLSSADVLDRFARKAVLTYIDASRERYEVAILVDDFARRMRGRRGKDLTRIAKAEAVRLWEKTLEENPLPQASEADVLNLVRQRAGSWAGTSTSVKALSSNWWGVTNEYGQRIGLASLTWSNKIGDFDQIPPGVRELLVPMEKLLDYDLPTKQFADGNHLTVLAYKEAEVRGLDTLADKMSTGESVGLADALLRTSKAVLVCHQNGVLLDALSPSHIWIRKNNEVMIDPLMLCSTLLCNSQTMSREHVQLGQLFSRVLFGVLLDRKHLAEELEKLFGSLGGEIVDLLGEEGGLQTLEKLPSRYLPPEDRPILLPADIDPESKSIADNLACYLHRALPAGLAILRAVRWYADDLAASPSDKHDPTNSIAVVGKDGDRRCVVMIAVLADTNLVPRYVHRMSLCATSAAGGGKNVVFSGLLVDPSKSERIEFEWPEHDTRVVKGQLRECSEEIKSFILECVRPFASGLDALRASVSLFPDADRFVECRLLLSGSQGPVIRTCDLAANPGEKATLQMLAGLVEPPAYIYQGIRIFRPTDVSKPHRTAAFEIDLCVVDRFGIFVFDDKAYDNVTIHEDRLPLAVKYGTGWNGPDRQQWERWVSKINKHSRFFSQELLEGRYPASCQYAISLSGSGNKVYHRNNTLLDSSFLCLDELRSWYRLREANATGLLNDSEIEQLAESLENVSINARSSDRRTLGPYDIVETWPGAQFTGDSRRLFFVVKKRGVVSDEKIAIVRDVGYYASGEERISRMNAVIKSFSIKGRTSPHLLVAEELVKMAPNTEPAVHDSEVGAIIALFAKPEKLQVRWWLPVIWAAEKAEKPLAVIAGIVGAVKGVVHLWRAGKVYLGFGRHSIFVDEYPDRWHGYLAGLENVHTHRQASEDGITQLWNDVYSLMSDTEVRQFSSDLGVELPWIRIAEMIRVGNITKTDELLDSLLCLAQLEHSQN